MKGMNAGAEHVWQARSISYREQSSKMYQPVAFTLAMVVAEMPYSALCAVAFYVCIYFPPGMNTSSTRAGYQFLMILICEFFAVSLAQMVAALTPSVFIASLLNPFLIIIFTVFVCAPSSHPVFLWRWSCWLKLMRCTAVRRDDSKTEYSGVLASMALPAEPVHPDDWRNGGDGAARHARCLPRE